MTKYTQQPEVTLKIKENQFHENYASIENIEALTPELKKLSDIREKIKQQIHTGLDPLITEPLMDLVSSENLLRISFAKIKSNKGAGTAGSKDESIESFQLQDIKKLHEEIEQGIFKWKALKRVNIKRPGKKPRPLGLPNFTEKLIQNNITMILTSIYEPIFDKTNKNNGFRPFLGTHDCIREITKNENQGLHLAIEGDIQGAFDNVNPSKLIEIIGKTIKDHEFLNLIYEACIVPILYKGLLYKNDLGTPQGSIMSPILFNIYMNEFDDYIIKLFEEMENTYNPTKTNQPTNPKYRKKTNIIIKLKEKLEILQIKKINQRLDQIEKQYEKHLKKAIHKQTIERTKIDTVDHERNKIRHFYNRYADDFLILTNWNTEYCQTLKEKIASFLWEELKLKLSEEKTLITDLRQEQVKYLGFVLFMHKPRLTLRKNSEILTRMWAKQISTGINLEKHYNTLITTGFATKTTLEPTSKPSITFFNDHEIIEYYNSKLLGIANYFIPVIQYRSQLNRTLYILYYSCIKTLAQKYKTTTKKIFKKYGYTEINTDKQNKTKRIVASYLKITKDDKKITKYITLLNPRDTLNNSKIISKNLRNKPQQISNKYNRTIENIWKQYKFNWRTRFKLDEFCNICGATGENTILETHHVKKIGGPTLRKDIPFITNVMQNLNRKQLIICQECHLNIHLGKYDGMSPKQIYDIRLSRIENYLKAKTTSFYKNERIYKSHKIGLIRYNIDPFSRTLKKYVELPKDTTENDAEPQIKDDDIY